MELNREKIKKALECCKVGEDCWACPYDNVGVYSQCVPKLLEDALSLIKELTEEVADLKAIAEQYQKQFEDCAEDRAKLTEENESLSAYVENLQHANTHLSNTLWDEVRETNIATTIDTVRKMQERLNKHFCHDPAFLGVEQRLINDVIDQIAKEMLEGENEN